MPLRKYQAASNKDERVVSTGDGHTFIRGRSDGTSLEPPIFTISATEGEEVSASISGEHPNWHIELVLRRGEKGDKGDTGDTGPQGPAGVCDCCDPECPPDMTFIRGVSTDDIYYDAGCGPWTIGYHIVNIVADGNCGEKEDAYDQWNVGDVGTCNGYIYSVDGSGNVTSRPEGGGEGGGGGEGTTCPEGYYWDGTCCQPNP